MLRTATLLGALHARLPSDGRRLVHGDFWLGNLLVEGDRITGVIDWTEAGTGDPQQDLDHLVAAHLQRCPAAAPTKSAVPPGTARISAGNRELLMIRLRVSVVSLVAGTLLLVGCEQESGARAGVQASSRPTATTQEPPHSLCSSRKLGRLTGMTQIQTVPRPRSPALSAQDLGFPVLAPDLVVAPSVIRVTSAAAGSCCRTLSLLYHVPTPANLGSPAGRVFVVEQRQDIDAQELDAQSRVTDFTDLTYECFDIAGNQALLFHNIHNGDTRVTILVRGVKVNITGPSLSAELARSVAVAIAAAA